MTVEVVIPVYRPGKKLKECVKRLTQQSVPLQKIHLVVTVEYDTDLLDEKEFLWYPQVEITNIPKKKFDHGGVRDWWMRHLDADIVIFMVQDAVPKKRTLVEQLICPFADEKMAVVYARHVVDASCDEIERYTRFFNYPPESMIKTAGDEARLGIKTYFSSNVCAAYRREYYLQTTGFGQSMIASEDLVYAWKALHMGLKMMYAADAQVIHYHRYSIWEQMRRNFDIGVVHAEHPEIFRSLHSQKEGIQMVKQTAVYLLRKKKPWLLVTLVIRSAAKFLGYQLGKHYLSLPDKIKCLCTRNPDYWKKV